jgi:hypothetical protein
LLIFLAIAVLGLGPLADAQASQKSGNSMASKRSERSISEIIRTRGLCVEKKRCGECAECGDAAKRAESNWSTWGQIDMFEDQLVPKAVGQNSSVQISDMVKQPGPQGQEESKGPARPETSMNLQRFQSKEEEKNQEEEKKQPLKVAFYEEEKSLPPTNPDLPQWNKPKEEVVENEDMTEFPLCLVEKKENLYFRTPFATQKFGEQHITYLMKVEKNFHPNFYPGQSDMARKLQQDPMWQSFQKANMAAKKMSLILEKDSGIKISLFDLTAVIKAAMQCFETSFLTKDTDPMAKLHGILPHLGFLNWQATEKENEISEMALICLHLAFGEDPKKPSLKMRAGVGDFVMAKELFLPKDTNILLFAKNFLSEGFGRSLLMFFLYNLKYGDQDSQKWIFLLEKHYSWLWSDKRREDLLDPAVLEAMVLMMSFQGEVFLPLCRALTSENRIDQLRHYSSSLNPGSQEYLATIAHIGMVDKKEIFQEVIKSFRALVQAGVPKRDIYALMGSVIISHGWKDSLSTPHALNAPNGIAGWMLEYVGVDELMGGSRGKSDGYFIRKHIYKRIKKYLTHIPLSEEHPIFELCWSLEAIFYAPLFSRKLSRKNPNVLYGDGSVRYKSSVMNGLIGTILKVLGKNEGPDDFLDKEDPLKYFHLDDFDEISVMMNAAKDFISSFETNRWGNRPAPRSGLRMERAWHSGSPI